MRVAVVFVPGSNRDKLLSISKALAKGIESNGHRVEIVDAGRDVNTKLTIFEYIAVGTQPITFFTGKVPDRLSMFLKNSGMVVGKKSFAFTIKKGLGTDKALSRTMKTMEAEGMFLRFSEILSSEVEAEEIGKRLKIS